MTGAELRRVLSKNLKSLRNKLSLSQIELAEKANVSIPFLSNIERGIKWPHPDTLVKLASALDIEVYTLFQENIPSPPDSARKMLARFKKDITASMHKTVSEAIDKSIETVGSHYVKGEAKRKK